ncbi:MAG: hypothetical protein R2867_44190 [Caldilineaceae bacterium]
MRRYLQWVAWIGCGIVLLGLLWSGGRYRCQSTTPAAATSVQTVRYTSRAGARPNL